MRHLATIGAVVVIAAFLTACGTSSSPTGSVGATASSPAEPGGSCRAQFEAWRHGPAKTAAEKLIAKFNALKNDADAADLPRTDAALKEAGRTVAAVQAYPIPHCADPHGYWTAILTRVRSAGDNAGSSQGLGGLLLAMVPLKQVPGLLNNLSAELKQTTGVSKAFG
jgi:hypothetical protein